MDNINGNWLTIKNLNSAVVATLLPAESEHVDDGELNRQPAMGFS